MGNSSSNPSGPETTSFDKQILYKQDSLIDLKNETLMNQIRKLENIQSSIINKDRIIDQMNQNIGKSNSLINFLIIVFTSSIILFFAIIANGYKGINNNIFRIIFVIVVLYIILSYLYIFNIFYLNDGINFVKYNQTQLVNNSLKDWSKRVYNEVYDEEEDLEWKNNNCDCPIAEEEFQYNQSKSFNFKGVSDKERVKGHFYYDGDAPPQLLVPTPLEKTGLDAVNDVIDWVNYSNNGETTYYDYPNNSLQNNLNNSHTFVDNTTYSANF
jgi:hypothetical protein